MNIFQVIEQYDQIAIFRHIRPDFDAYGSQYGLARVIKDLYPDKQVMLLGEKVEDMLSQMQVEEFDIFESNNNALAIVLDTATFDRIDGDVTNYKEIMKIDHHIVVDSYGKYNIEYPKKSSACQIVAELCKEYLQNKISIQAATYLYFGMITDSNRFLYDSTDCSTFQAAGYLVDCGLQISKVYNALYTKNEKELQIQGYILSRYKKAGNVLYYVLMQSDLDALEISRSKGSDYVNLLANIEDYPIWVAVTENTEENNFRVSIRSRKIIINDIANQYHGGGHANASGCTLESYDQLSQLLDDLQKRYEENPEK